MVLAVEIRVIRIKRDPAYKISNMLLNIWHIQSNKDKAGSGI